MVPCEFVLNKNLVIYSHINPDTNSCQDATVGSGSGAPVHLWYFLYYCIRVGDMKSAAAALPKEWEKLAYLFIDLDDTGMDIDRHDYEYARKVCQQELEVTDPISEKQKFVVLYLLSQPCDDNIPAEALLV
jgi:hypothetical protein